MSGAAPPLDIAAGAVGAGLLVEYGPDPTGLVYWLLLGVFAAATLGVLAMPEPVRKDESWLRALQPHVRLPREARSMFASVAPCLIGVWALSAL